MKLTTSQFANLAEISHPKAKRWVREALPHDPNATARSGYVRRFTLDDGFIVLLYGWTMGSYRFSSDEAKTFVSTMRPWLEKRFFPMNKWTKSPVSAEQWEIAVNFLVSAKDGEIIVFAEARGKHSNEVIENGENWRRYRQEYTAEPIGTDRYLSEKTVASPIQGGVVNISWLAERYCADIINKM